MKEYKVILLIIILFFSDNLFSQKLNIDFFGHACFMITTENGVQILIDPVKLQDYSLPDGLKPDIVTVSHLHGDHNNVAAVGGEPIVLYGLKKDHKGKESYMKIDTTISGIRIFNIKCFHHDPEIRKGLNTIFIYEFNGVRIAHLGDLGVLLTDEQIIAIGDIDILMIPVGGKYTITPDQAGQVVEMLSVKHYIFPMHYKCDIANFLPYSIDDFIKDKESIKVLEGNKIKVDLDSPPSELTYVKIGYR